MIGINEAIIGCIERLLEDRGCSYKTLMKLLEIGKNEMKDYTSCKKSIPLACIGKIARFFNMSLEEFFVKAGVNRGVKDNTFGAEKIMYFKKNFLAQWSENKLIGQFED